MRKAAYQSHFDGIGCDRHNGDVMRRLLSCKRAGREQRYDDLHLFRDKLGRQLRQRVEPSGCGADIEEDILSLDKAGLAQYLLHLSPKRFGIRIAQQQRADAMHLALLRPHRERPSESPAAEQSDSFSPPDAAHTTFLQPRMAISDRRPSRASPSHSQATVGPAGESLAQT